MDPTNPTNPNPQAPSVMDELLNAANQPRPAPELDPSTEPAPVQEPAAPAAPAPPDPGTEPTVPAEPGPAEPVEPAAEPKPGKPSLMDDLRGERARRQQLQQENQLLQERLERVEALLGGGNPPAAPTAPAALNAPAAEDRDPLAELGPDDMPTMKQWREHEAWQGRQQQRAQQEAAQRQQMLVEQYTRAVEAEGEANFEDFREVTEAARGLLTPAEAEQIRAAKTPYQAAKTAYEICKGKRGPAAPSAPASPAGNLPRRPGAPLQPQNPNPNLNPLPAGAGGIVEANPDQIANMVELIQRIDDPGKLAQVMAALN
jgi:hypothetical protein